VTTLMAKSAFPETHEPPLRLARHARRQVVELGDEQVRRARRHRGPASTTRVTGKLAAFAPGASVVHLDVDAAEIGKLRHADIPVVGPLKQILAELGERVRAAPRDGDAPRPGPWLAQLADWRDEFPLRYGRPTATCSSPARPRGAAGADERAATT
jgi:acetolactate synthase-1/2/3 large subunit